MTKLSKDSMTYKVLEAFSHYLEHQELGLGSIEEVIRENEGERVLEVYHTTRGEMADWEFQLSYDLENELWEAKYVGEPSFVINVKSTKNEFIEEMKGFREDPEYLIYDKQNIDDEDLETLRTLYRRGTPVTKEELDEVFGEETDYKILA